MVELRDSIANGDLLIFKATNKKTWLTTQNQAVKTKKRQATTQPEITANSPFTAVFLQVGDEFCLLMR
jgi:hypothetical protein